jgi:hypothetical protein
MSRLSFGLRLLFLAGFIMAVPLLALPSVARRLDEVLYGGQKTTTDVPLSAAGGDSFVEGAVAQAAFEVPRADSERPHANAQQNRGLDAVARKPPELAAIPEFPQLGLDDSPSFGPSNKIQPLDRIRQIRQRLEDLGADYLLLESVEETGQHRFECRMLVVPGGTETETFEATGKDAKVVAEQVLSAVEKWRSSQVSTLR